MSDIRIVAIDTVYIGIDAEPAILYELAAYFSFYVKGYEFSPAYKNKQWDGKIRLFQKGTQKIYAGLLFEVLKYAQREGYSVSIDEDVQKPQEEPSKESIDHFFHDHLNIHAHGKKIQIRPAQEQAFTMACASERCTLEAATSSGKSLTIYGLCRYYSDLVLEEDEKILIIVPTTGLVDQMYSDFEDYASQNEWNVQENCHKIYSGQEKKVNKKIFISTYHSIADLPKKYFEQFKMVIGDEAHIFKAKTLKKLMQKLTDCPYRFAFTGTLQEAECHRWVIEGLFGTAYEIVNAQEMIARGEAPPLEIKVILMKHPEDVCKSLYNDKSKPENQKRKYHVEYEYIIDSQIRNDFVVSFADSLKGNTLVLVERPKTHGIKILEELQKVRKDVYFVYGDVETGTREEIRKIVETKDNAVIIASYGVFSTGVSIRNLHNLVFASSPGKEKQRVVQSIGRILRQHESKTTVSLYDLVDDFSYKDNSCYMIDQFMERINIYINEGHDYTIVSGEL